MKSLYKNVLPILLCLTVFDATSILLFSGSQDLSAGAAIYTGLQAFILSVFWLALCRL